MPLVDNGAVCNGHVDAISAYIKNSSDRIGRKPMKMVLLKVASLPILTTIWF